MTDHDHAHAATVGYQDLRDYLVARAWQNVPSRLDHVAIYRSPDDGDVEVQVPLDTSLADYVDAILLAARRIAGSEARTVGQVLHDLTRPRSDTLRFALGGQATRAGSIGMTAGLALVQGALKSLLASACSVQRPRRFHPRMSLGEAESFVRACRLGQTELGSYVLTVDAPVDAPGPRDGDGTPFGRRATIYLLASAAHLVATIRRGDVARILDDDPAAPQISANLCEALVEMMPVDESADLRLTSSWSPVIPVPKDLPAAVCFDRTMFEPIERLAQQLRPAHSAGPVQFVGKVVELSGASSPTGQLEGDVVLQVQVEDQLLKVRTTLGPEAYTEAGRAHLSQQYVSLHGQLHRGRRTHALKDPADFKVLPP